MTEFHEDAFPCDGLKFALDEFAANYTKRLRFVLFCELRLFTCLLVMNIKKSLLCNHQNLVNFEIFGLNYVN